jgi:hypothetical protein
MTAAAIAFICSPPGFARDDDTRPRSAKSQQCCRSAMRLA